MNRKPSGHGNNTSHNNSNEEKESLDEDEIDNLWLSLPWIVFILFEFGFVFVKYGLFHKKTANEENTCQRYIFNMQREGCPLYIFYIVQAALCTFIFFVELVICAFYWYPRWKGKFCEFIDQYRSHYIKNFFFPHSLIIANCICEAVISGKNGSYGIQILVDLFGYLLYFVFLDYSSKIIGKIKDSQRKHYTNDTDNELTWSNNCGVSDLQVACSNNDCCVCSITNNCSVCDLTCSNNCCPRCNCNWLLPIHVFTAVLAHFLIIWIILGKLDEDYNWEEITIEDENGDIKWSKGEKNAIFWQIQLEILIVIQWFKGSIEKVVKEMYSEHTSNGSNDNENDQTNNRANYNDNNEDGNNNSNNNENDNENDQTNNRANDNNDDGNNNSNNNETEAQRKDAFVCQTNFFFFFFFLVVRNVLLCQYLN